MKLSHALLLSLALNVFLLPNSASARQEVDSADRLAMLNTATGNDSIQNSFQRRVDAIMNIDTSTNRDFVATQDERARLEAQQQLIEQQEAEMIRLNPPAPPKADDEIPKIGGKIDPDPFSDGMDRKMQDASNQAFEQTTSDIYKNIDERRKIADIRQAESPETKESTNPGDKLLSLTNNPFYIAPSTETEESGKTFDENKGVIASRLYQMGRPQDEINEIMRRAATPEELVIILMNEIGYTYSQAAEATEVSAES